MVSVFERILREMGQRIVSLNGQIAAGTLAEHDPSYAQCAQCAQDTLWAIQNLQIYLELSPRCSYSDDVFGSGLIDIIIAKGAI